MKRLYMLVGVLLFLLGVSASAQDVKTFVPPNATPFLPIVASETQRMMPDVPTPGYFGALIEQESCISLTHSRCWKPTSQLKTSRELGIGLGQITKAYKADGSVRFDALKEMRDKHQAELKDLSWLTVKERPDLQIRAIILMIRDNYQRLFTVVSKMDRLQMADAAYNGGFGGLNKERIGCGMAKGCDPQRWFGHVEKYCLKGTKPLYGNRTACMINREHPELIFHVRLKKYQRLLDPPKKAGYDVQLASASAS